MRKQIRRHECAIGVTTDGDPITVCDTAAHGLINRLCSGDELIDIPHEAVR